MTCELIAYLEQMSHLRLPNGQAAVFLPEPLAFDQQGQAVFEGQRDDVVLLALFFEGLGQARQAQGAELF